MRLVSIPSPGTRVRVELLSTTLLSVTHTHTHTHTHTCKTPNPACESMGKSWRTCWWRRLEVGAHGVTRDESVTDARMRDFNWLLFGAFGCSLFCLLLLLSKTGFCVPPIYIKPKDDVARVLLSIWVGFQSDKSTPRRCSVLRDVPFTE